MAEKVKKESAAIMCLNAVEKAEADAIVTTERTERTERLYLFSHR